MKQKLIINTNLKFNIKILDYYKENFETNPILLNLLEFNEIELFLNLKKNNNEIFNVHLISVFQALSLKFTKEKFSLTFSLPINMKREEYPVDLIYEVYNFNNGLYIKNLKKDNKSFIFKKSYNILYPFIKDYLFNNNIFEPFYDCNYPEVKDGYTIKKIADDLYEYKKIYVNQKISNISKKRNTINYLKWNLTDDLSIRFFVVFEDSKNKENKYFIKSHKNKSYIELTEKEAEHMVNEFKCDKCLNIIGYKLGNKYIKKIYDSNLEYKEINKK